eukprot:PhF_6_TR42189/c1_g1_i1/m.63821
MSDPPRLKIIILGDSGVGKTTLVETFQRGEYHEQYPTTISYDFLTKIVKLKKKTNAGDDISVKLQMWDTAGQERFRYIVRSYYRGAHGCVIVFDVTQPVEESKEQVQRWVEELNSKAPNCPYVVVGNKIDLLPEGCTHSLRRWGHWSERKRG